MPKKVVVMLAAAAAVVALVLWFRKRAEQAGPKPIYDPPVRPSPTAEAANALSGLVTAGSNWAAQWLDYGGQRVAGAVASAIPIAQAAKPKANTNTALTLVQSPMYGR